MKAWRRKRGILKIHKKYAFRFKQLEYKRKLALTKVYDLHKRRQVDDYVACINFRLHFISKSLSSATISEVNRYKAKYYRKQDFRKISALNDVVHLDDTKDRETALINLIQEDRKKWVLWK